LKPTRLAAREFEESRIQWAHGPEGGVLEPASEDAAVEELVDEEAVG
jgi:hypothetical protein